MSMLGMDVFSSPSASQQYLLMTNRRPESRAMELLSFLGTCAYRRTIALEKGRLETPTIGLQFEHARYDCVLLFNSFLTVPSDDQSAPRGKSYGAA